MDPRSNRRASGAAKRTPRCGHPLRWLVTIGVAAAIANAAPADATLAIDWRASVEIARGGGHRGPWRQNDSNYDYVDDATVAFAADGDTLVAWVDQRRRDVLVQRYDPGGKPRRERPVNVSRTAQVFSWLPRVAVSPATANVVFVVWQEIVFSGGSHGGDILFARSDDGGASFGEPVNLSRSRAGDGKGRIRRDHWHNGSLDVAVAGDGTVHVAWTEYEGALWLARSVDGERFSAATRIAGDEASPARAPALAIGPDASLYLAWTVGEHDDADVRVARSVDGGRTFAAPVLVAPTPTYSDAPKVAIDPGGTLHIAYAESAGGPFDRHHVRYSRSTDHGRTFERPRELSRAQSPGTPTASFPALALDRRGNVCVVWETYPHEHRPPRGLAIACSSDGGTRFGAPTAVPDSVDAAGGWNGSHQGLLMCKLAMNATGAIAIVNNSLLPGRESRAWLMRGQLRPP